MEAEAAPLLRLLAKPLADCCMIIPCTGMPSCVDDKLDLSIHVSHFPPGTSKGNKVEHRLFSFISINWRGRPLRCYETIVSLIGNTTNRGGLVVGARLDRRRYPIGKKVSAKDLRALNSERDDFHGDWNYVIKPRGQPQ